MVPWLRYLEILSKGLKRWFQNTKLRNTEEGDTPAAGKE
ncbi:rCG33120, partial [Rattus norvegicus]